MLGGGVLLSIPVGSRNPAGAARLIDFFLNDVDAIEIMGLQRGLPPSERARKILASSITASENAEVDYGRFVAGQAAGEALPAAPTAPPGYGEVKAVLESAAKQIAFGNVSISDGVARFFSDAKAALAAAKLEGANLLAPPQIRSCRGPQDASRRQRSRLADLSGA